VKYGLLTKGISVALIGALAACGGDGGGSSSSGDGGGGSSGSSATETACTRDTGHDETCVDFWGGFDVDATMGWNCPDGGEALKLADERGGECNSTSADGWNGYCCSK
jgi:hypothetical protein